MTSAPGATPWLTSWMPCWIELDLLAARSSAHRDLPQPLPFPRHGRCPCRPSGVPPAAPSQRLSALGLWEVAPRGAEGTRQNWTPQQSPLPVCNLTGWPCLLDRDPGESFLSRKKEVVAGLLGYFLCPPSVSSPCAKVLWPPTVLSWRREAGGGGVSGLVPRRCSQDT